MRVITGTARGRRLTTLSGEDVRPTGDKVKESMFSIIQFEVEGRRVLDLFAGSGQLGIEALSRGAESAVFVDKEKASLAVVKENLERTGLSPKAELVNTDALVYLGMAGGRFDLVFIDPPYALGLIPKILPELIMHLSDDAIIVCETDAQTVLTDTVGDFTARLYRYGKTAVFVYRRGAAS